MHPLVAGAYEAAARLAGAAAAVAPAGDAKVLRALRGRRGVVARYRAWGDGERDPARPLLWMHAPSVGEGLQARPVLERLRAARPATQLAYTFFSPSAEPFARRLDVDFRDYLPFDAAGDVRAALDALRPSALVFSKLDVWPRLVATAADRDVPLGLISATLARGAGRGRPGGALLLRDAYAALDAIGAIDAEDAERLVALGARPSAIRVTGDTRYDQVWVRAQGADRAGVLLAPLRSGRPTLVAGSTWPPDEERLLAAWTLVRRRVPDARLVLAPHEPTPAHLAPFTRWAGESRLALARLANASPTIDVILVDRVGVLGDLYALADAAYVGGGFHAAGLHSVLEPAAYGVPVLFGPRHGHSRDARLLMAAGGGATATTPAALADRLASWLGDARAREAAGRAARAVVVGGLGAADRSLGLVLELLDGHAQAGR
ncbi:MAG TPA: glycosyltransferase N-terminal domain-containing protein [Gemmatimonadaceae bacterium]|nr:glycosyltransferase N-terminal domain-containing protein [Gemmatimonadaceae bacterium]